MAKVTEVGITAGVGTTGTGTAATLDGIFNRDAGPVVITTAAGVTAASLFLPVALPATGTTVSISASQLGALGQATMATSASVTIASDQSSVQTLQSVRANKGVNLVTLATTTETVIATAISGKFIDLYGLVFANTSATATTIVIKDVTAGTTKLEFNLPAGDTRGIALSESAAITAAATNTNWTATLGTSVSGVVVTALYVKN